MAAPPDRGVAAAARWMGEPLVSVIVPVLNESGQLPAFLAHLQAWRQQVEIIVVDGGSSDGSDHIALPLCDTLLHSAPGRARQMNLGAQAACGAWLFFLHCDTRLQRNPATFFTTHGDAPDWGFCEIRLSGSDWRFRVIESAMNVRSRLTAIGSGDQCLFVSRANWQRCGGYAEIPLMEDIEICKRLRRESRPYIAARAATTSSRRWEQYGIFSTVLLMWRLRLAYWLGAAPEQLQRRYRG